MDYGHELEFGAFLTPEAAQLDRLLENAQLADVLGLDLVCLQDHPYAAKQADMWTLLSVIGARTTTVRVLVASVEELAAMKKEGKLITHLQENVFDQALESVMGRLKNDVA